MLRCRPGTAKSTALVALADSAVQFAERHSSERKVGSEISPVRIQALDKLDLPGSSPAFETCFACAGFENGRILLEVNQ